MSKENAKKFFEKMKTDQNIGKVVIEAIGQISKASTKEEAVKIFETNVLGEAKKQGLDFTLDEIPSDLFGSSNSKLSLDELSNVSGGFSLKDAKNIAQEVYKGGKTVTNDIWNFISDKENMNKVLNIFKFVNNFSKES